MRTLAEAMAIAVLKGDMAAACALADKLIEERQQVRPEFTQHPELGRPVSGYEVYRWPEFIAFAGRLGFKWDLATTRVVITIAHDEMVCIDHTYQGRELPAAVETTTVHNQQFHTFIPPGQ